MLQSPRRGDRVAVSVADRCCRLEVVGQDVVDTQGGGYPMGQSRMALNDIGRQCMEVPAVGRTEIGIDRRPVQRVGKGELRR